MYTFGVSQLPDNTAANIVSGFPRDVNHAIDLNSFFGYPSAINRTTGVRGQFVTDPSCLYDAATQRFFVIALTLESQVPGPCQRVFSCVNHLDIAVSQTSNPTGTWNIYRVVAWTLTNTPLNAVPALSLSNKVLSVNQYGVPPKQQQQQPGSGAAPRLPFRKATASTTPRLRRLPVSAAGGSCSSASRRTTRSSRGRTRTTPACSR
jgi:hypothetical protein